MFIAFEYLAMLFLGATALTQVIVPILRSQPIFPFFRKMRPTEEKRLHRAQERLLLARRELEAARAEAQAVELETVARKLREENLAKMVGEEIAAAEAPATPIMKTAGDTPAEEENEGQTKKGLRVVGGVGGEEK